MYVAGWRDEHATDRLPFEQAQAASRAEDEGGGGQAIAGQGRRRDDRDARERPGRAAGARIDQVVLEAVDRPTLVVTGRADRFAGSLQHVRYSIEGARVLDADPPGPAPAIATPGENVAAGVDAEVIEGGQLARGQIDGEPLATAPRSSTSGRRSVMVRRAGSSRTSR